MASLEFHQTLNKKVTVENECRKKSRYNMARRLYCLGLASVGDHTPRNHIEHSLHTQLWASEEAGEQLFSQRPPSHHAWECTGKQHLAIFLVSFYVCVCVWVHLWLFGFASGAGRLSLEKLSFASFYWKIPQLTYFPIMESSSQRVFWLKIDKFLDKKCK